MRDIEQKAVRLILEGKVYVESVALHDDGRVDEALGLVEGDSGKTWTVQIEGDATSCDCPYGIARQDAGGHSHDLALRLAATKSGATAGVFNEREGGTK